MKNNRFNQECVTPSGSIVVCDENGRKVELHCGNEEFVKIKIDGCVEQTGAENLRCDFMIIKKKRRYRNIHRVKGARY